MQKSDYSGLIAGMANRMLYQPDQFTIIQRGDHLDVGDKVTGFVIEKYNDRLKADFPMTKTEETILDSYIKFLV